MLCKSDKPSIIIIIIINFNPDINTFSMQNFNEVCSLNFNEDRIIEYMNTLCEEWY